MRTRAVKLPRVSTPPKMYRVTWIDANFDVDHDGPSDEFESELVPCPHIGYLVKIARDHIVLAGSAWVSNGGRLESRFHMTIPRVHLTSLTELGEDPAVGRGPAESAPPPTLETHAGGNDAVRE